MVEEYVKDLFWIGFILFVTPVVLVCLALALAVLGQPMELDSALSFTMGTLSLAGLLIMVYLSIKYYYKEGRYGKSQCARMWTHC